MIKDVLPPRINITLGGKETFLQYNTFVSSWYLEENNVDVNKIFDTENGIEILHLLRAGLIQANWEENKPIIDKGKINDVNPSLSEVAEMIAYSGMDMLRKSIVDGMVKSIPTLPIGAKPESSKKKQTG